MPRRSGSSVRGLAALAVAIAGCQFEPSGLGEPPDDAALTDVGAGEGDGGGSDGAIIDAAIDARVIDAAPSCPSGYVSLGASSTRYKLIESTKSWAEAAADCNDDDDAGGFTKFTHLAVIGDELERLSVIGSISFSGNRWIGLEDTQTDGLFVWVTAENTGGYPTSGQRPPWDNGEPNGQLADNCVRFKGSFRFEDKNCLDGNKVLCECDDFPPR